MASHNRSISQTFNKENRLKEANQAWHFHSRGIFTITIYNGDI